MRIASLRLLSLSILVSVGFAIGGCSGGASSSTPAVTIGGSATLTIDQGQAVTITATVANDSNSAGVTWTLSGVGTLSGNSVTSVTYTSPSSVTSTTTVTITATSITNAAITSTRTITLTGVPSITSSTLPAGTVGTAYNQTLADTGGAGSLVWTVNSGTLPTGITLSSAGVLSGTVSVPSTSVLTFKVTDSSSVTPLSATSGNITLTFNPVTLTVVAPTLANAIQGTAYTATAATSTGGTGAITWTASGLPAGLSINSSTGIVSGTPTASGASTNVIITATDTGTSPFQQTKSTAALSLTVIPTLTVGSLSSSNAVQSVTSVSVAAPAVSGGVSPYTFTLSGAPAGLTIDGSGNVTGTPTAASGSPYTVVVTVKDSGAPQQTKTSSFTLAVTASLVVTSPTLANAVQGSLYTSTAFTTSGGTGSVTWSATGLPAGLSIGASSGVIGGTPTGSGTSSNVIVTATDSGAGSLQQAKSASALTITVIPTLTITTSSLPVATLGSSYSGTTLQATGGSGNLNWSASGLPNGLSVNSSTGVIAGTPTATTSGTATVTINVSDSGTPQQTKSTMLSLTLNAGVPVVTTSNLPPAIVNTSYSQTLGFSADGQVGTPQWNVSINNGGLTSAGFTLNSSTGVLSGSSSSNQTVNFSVTVTVGGQTSQPRSLSLVVNVASQPLQIILSNGAAVSGEVQLPFALFPVATGGNSHYTWSVSSGTLPAGLSIASSTGAITGQPTGTGTGTFTLQLADSVSDTPATQVVSYTINATRSNGANAELQGQYAFMVTGFDQAGDGIVRMGSFTADGNGNITGGSYDVNSTVSAPSLGNTFATGGTYSLGADGRGKATMAQATSSITYVMVADTISGGKVQSGHLMRFDASGINVTGRFALQDATAFNTNSLNGGYAFGLAGPTAGSNKSNMGRSAVIGVWQLDGAGNLGVTNTEFLVPNSGSPSPITLSTPGTYTVSGTNGRGMLSFSVPGGGSTQTVDLIFYVISASKAFVMVSDAATNGANQDLISGVMQKRTLTTFNAASLNGASVFATTGLIASGGSPNPIYNSQVELGVLTWNGAGMVTASLDNNSGGNADNVAFGSGTGPWNPSGGSANYTVSPNGLVTIVTGGGGDNPYFYLIGQNKGFVLDFSSNVDFGQLEPQTIATLTGSFSAGSVAPAVNDDNQMIAVTVGSGGAVTGSKDDNEAGTLAPDNSITGATLGAADANGRVIINPPGGSSSGAPQLLYVVSATKAYELNLSTGNPILVEFIHQ